MKEMKDKVDEACNLVSFVPGDRLFVKFHLMLMY